VEQLSLDLTSERSTSQKIEGERALLERQNKELKGKLAELDAQLKMRSKVTIQALEGRIANLEEQLEIEARFAQCTEFESYYCIVSRYLYSTSHSISQTEALFSAFRLQEKGKT